MNKINIAPSLLSANFSKLGQEILDLEKAGADFFHIDVMDGNFVPNLSFGATVIKDIRSLTNKVFDVHLMVKSPENYINEFAKIGADIITFHIEATKHPLRIVDQIKKHNIKAGIAINPATNEDVLKYIINEIDLVLVMSVNPGFGGQTFIESTIEKLQNIKKMIKKDILISVDGGVNDQNSLACIKAGANVLVAGSSIFTKFSNNALEDYKNNINNLLKA